MAIDVETGHFTKNNGGVTNETNVVSTAFQAKALIVWASYESESNAETDDHAILAIGFSDGTNHRAICSRHEDAVTMSDVAMALRNDACIAFILPTSETITSRASVAFNAIDITFTWNVADTKATIIHYIIYGGADITGVQVGDFTKSIAAEPVDQQITTDSDVQSITEGKGVVFIFDARENSMNSINSNESLSFGMATGTAKEVSMWEGNDDNTASSEQRFAYEEDKIVIGRSAQTGVLRYTGEFNGFNSTGFKVNWTTNNTEANIIPFLIIKGGQWEVGNETASTSVTTKATTTVFQPKGLFNIVTPRTATGLSQQDLAVTVGAAGSTTTEESAGITDKDAAAIMETGASSNITHCTRVLNATTTAPTVNGEAQLDGFNALDFTLDWTDAATALFKFLWCVCGDEAAPAAPVEQTQGMIIG